MNALIVVDMQNDFMPGGALGIDDATSIIKPINTLMPLFDLVVATQDWHPREHGSFVTAHPQAAVGDVVDLHGLTQVVWPVHCVQNSLGAQLHQDLNVAAIDKITFKGMDPRIDSYSGFFNNDHIHSTGLGDYLSKSKVDVVHIVGVATDYCVKYTVLDAIALGFKAQLIVDACRGVNLQTGDVDKAVDEMRAAGAVIRTVRDFL